MATTKIGIKNIFSVVARERCLRNLKKISIPSYGKPTAHASVLVPLCNVEEVPSLLYTIRTKHLQAPNGEVTFPGGKSEKGEDATQTALRVTFEEIGLSSKKIEIWGTGPAVPGRSYTMLITPVIGSVNDLKQEDFKIDSRSVLEVFTIPIEMLCEQKNQYYTQFSNGFILPVYVVEGYKIWGITAYITHAFLSSTLCNDYYKNEWMKQKIVLDSAEKIP